MEQIALTKKKPPLNRVRSYEVASLANISRSTVSRALSGDPRIPAATRERVLKAAAQLGYTPNLIARSLKNQKTGIVGLVISELENPFYALLLDVINRRLEDNGLASLLFVCPDIERFDDIVPRLMSYQVDAVIVATGPLSSTIADSCRAAAKPLVYVNRYGQHSGASAVTGDNVHGGEIVAAHLIASGARTFGLMAGLEGTSTNRDREIGLRGALADRGIVDVRRVTGHYSYEGAVAAAHHLLSQARPDAVFCANDAMACCLMDIARAEYGLRIPQDLSIIGYDNTPIAALPAYELSTVDQDIEKMAATTVDTVVSLIDEVDAPAQHHLIQPRLVVRKTTRPPAT